MVLSTHSHRYFNYGCSAQARTALYKLAKKSANVLYKTPFGKYLINKFYWLAKKI